jgi:hypothetical protein
MSKLLVVTPKAKDDNFFESAQAAKLSGERLKKHFLHTYPNARFETTVPFGWSETARGAWVCPTSRYQLLEMYDGRYVMY